MIKLIATDVDGTLLDDDSRLTELNEHALIDCIKAGINIVLATGKSIDAINPLVKLFDLKLPQITLNGAVVVESNSNILKAVKIKPPYFYSVINTIKCKGYNPLIALSDGRILYEKYDSLLEVFTNVNEPILKIDSIENDHYAKDCVSISVAIKEDDPLDSYLRKKYSHILQIVRSGEYFFDILNIDATKGNALGFICDIYRIKKNEVAVFGDSYNDLSMFGCAGIRIAVRNSYPEVLKEADYITDENYNSGLAKAIYKYILK